MEKEKQDHKLLDKMKANPSVPIGLAGCLGVVILGLYNFKNRKIQPSLYLIQMRVIAQGTVIGSISLGLLYTLTKKHLPKLFPSLENKNE